MNIRAGRPFRVLGWDIENRPSAYWFEGRTTSEITAIAWKWTDEGVVHSLLLNRHGRFVDETGKRISYRRAYERFRGELTSADLVFGHNIVRHDIGLFQAGLLRQEMEPLPALRTTDTLRDYPRRKDMSASLENLAAMYDLDDDGKLHMSVIDWERANRLDPEALDRAHLRVVRDVLLQERLREKLLELGLLGEPKMWRP